MNLLHTILGVFPERKDQEIPTPYRQSASPLAPAVMNGPSGGPSEGTAPHHGTTGTPISPSA